MTSFYCFESRESFLANGGEATSEYTKNDIGVSVIGEHYSENEEGEQVVIGFLVNTTSAVTAWEQWECFPVTPKRIFA